MNKTKSTAQNGSSTTTAEIYAGAETLKSGFNKTAKVLECAADFGKGNIEGYVASATAAGEGFRTISSELTLYSKKSIEESVAATKAIMASKSVHEAMELQSDFAKMAFGAYVGHLKLFNELYVATMKDALAPLQARVEAFTQIARNATAA
jgi:phasin family protein